MSQVLIYLNDVIEKKVGDLKSITKFSKADVIQKILSKVFEKDVNELNLMINQK